MEELEGQYDIKGLYGCISVDTWFHQEFLIEKDGSVSGTRSDPYSFLEKSITGFVYEESRPETGDVYQVLLMSYNPQTNRGSRFYELKFTKTNHKLLGIKQHEGHAKPLESDRQRFRETFAETKTLDLETHISEYEYRKQAA